MRMAGESSVMVVMPSNTTFQRPTPLSISSLPSLPPPTSDNSTDDLNTTPDNAVSRRRRRSTDDGSTTDEEGDIQKTKYECRFCNMWFAKSQALGGHMNRHRQEREKEQYQHAQQLVSSMVQQHMPRTWVNTLATDLNNNGSVGGGVPAASQLARLSPQVATGAPSSWPDSSRHQVAPQMSFTSARLPISTTSSPTTPDSLPSPHYCLPSNSSSNNLQQHPQWNVDVSTSNNNATLSRSGPQQGPSALDSNTVYRDGFFWSSVLQHRHDAGSFARQSQFINTTTVPLLNSRAVGLGDAAPFLFQEPIQGGSGATGLPIGHDHRISESSLRQLACTSSSPNSTFTQSGVNPNGDVRLPVRTPVSSPTYLTQCRNTVQNFKQPQMSVVSRSLGNPTAGQCHVMPSPLPLGHQFNSPSSAAPTFGALPGNHDFNVLQDYDNNIHAGNLQQAQYAVSRAPIAQTSSGSAASGSFGVSASHEPQGMTYGQATMHPGESDGYNHLCREASQIMDSTTAVAQPQPQQLNTATSVVHEVVDGNHCESMNITTITESGDVSGMSAPARYHSTDFSSGSPEWRTQNNSPSGQANHASPPSQEYCSG